MANREQNPYQPPYEKSLQAEAKKPAYVVLPRWKHGFWMGLSATALGVLVMSVCMVLNLPVVVFGLPVAVFGYAFCFLGLTMAIFCGIALVIQGALNR